MKKQIILALMLASACIGLQAQTYTTLGIGINQPNGTLHVHSSEEHYDFPPVDPINPGFRELGDTAPIDPIFYYYNTILRITNTQTGYNNEDGFTIDQYNKDVRLRQFEEADLTMENHNAKVVLTSEGKVGIGAASSTHFFNVEGNTRMAGSLTTTGGLNINNSAITLSSDGKAHFADEVTIGNGFFYGSDGTLTVGTGFSCAADGALKVKSLKVTTTDWPDYVFGGNHRLMSLEEVEDYINANGHLPEVPSAAEAETEGVDVGEMNKLLLQKVEELTLYVIDLQKQLDELKSN
jgi:hypothetical protein